MGRSAGRRVVVAGHGMAGARFVRRLAAWDPDARIAVYDTETRPGYNRLLLTGVLAGRHRPRDITTPAPPGVEVHAAVRLVAVNQISSPFGDQANPPSLAHLEVSVVFLPARSTTATVPASSRGKA